MSAPEPSSIGEQQRRHLSFASEDEAIADVEKLRRGYSKTASWSLPQICWHLEKAVRYRMQPGPFPPNTPEQDARAPLVKQVLASGKLPPGIQAPEPMVPPPDAGDDAIDAFIASLLDIKAFAGAIAPHRIFGRLDDAAARRLNLIHCAHHLGFLVPTAG